jgi:hypothetical protein
MAHSMAVELAIVECVLDSKIAACPETSVFCRTNGEERRLAYEA